MQQCNCWTKVYIYSTIQLQKRLGSLGLTTAASARLLHLNLDQQKTGGGKSTSTNVGTVNVSRTLRLAA